MEGTAFVPCLGWRKSAAATDSEQLKTLQRCSEHFFCEPHLRLRFQLQGVSIYFYNHRQHYLILYFV